MPPAASIDDPAALARLLPLFRELNNLKRLRVAGRAGSWAERMFTRAWSRIAAGVPLDEAAYAEAAAAVTATLLAGVDAGVLAAGGVAASVRLEILWRAFDAAAAPLDPTFAAHLRDTLAAEPTGAPDAAPPSFVALLAAQPRAGATRPGHPRVVLEPAENHAEHCAVVAINGVLAASVFGADPRRSLSLRTRPPSAQRPPARRRGTPGTTSSVSTCAR